MSISKQIDMHKFISNLSRISGHVGKYHKVPSYEATEKYASFKKAYITMVEEATSTVDLDKLAPWLDDCPSSVWMHNCLNVYKTLYVILEQHGIISKDELSIFLGSVSTTWVSLSLLVLSYPWVANVKVCNCVDCANNCPFSCLDGEFSNILYKEVL